MPTSLFWTTVALTLSVALASPRPQSSMGAGGVPLGGATPSAPPGGQPPPGSSSSKSTSTMQVDASTTNTTTYYVGIPWGYCCPSLALFLTPAVSTPIVYQYPVVLQSFGWWWCCG